MINSADLSGKVAFDANSLNNLKQAAKESSPEAIKAVSKQFEAIFMNMMLKSMREASPTRQSLLITNKVALYLNAGSATE